MGETHGLSSTMRRTSEMEHVKKIIQVGARGIGSGQSSDNEDAVAWCVKFFAGPDLHRLGFQPAIDEIRPDTNVILCIEINAMDPSIDPTRLDARLVV